MKGGCVVPCVTDVDVTTTPDESGVGAIVDATVAEGKENMVLFNRYFNMSDNKTLYTS